MLKTEDNAKLLCWKQQVRELKHLSDLGDLRGLRGLKNSGANPRAFTRMRERGFKPSATLIEYIGELLCVHAYFLRSKE